MNVTIMVERTRNTRESAVLFSALRAFFMFPEYPYSVLAAF